MRARDDVLWKRPASLGLACRKHTTKVMGPWRAEDKFRGWRRLREEQAQGPAGADLTSPVKWRVCALGPVSLCAVHLPELGLHLLPPQPGAAGPSFLTRHPAGWPLALLQRGSLLGPSVQVNPFLLSQGLREPKGFPATGKCWRRCSPWPLWPPGTHRRSSPAPQGVGGGWPCWGVQARGGWAGGGGGTTLGLVAEPGRGGLLQARGGQGGGPGEPGR